MSLHVNEMWLARDAAFSAPDKPHEEIKGDFAHMQRSLDNASQARVAIGQSAADDAYFAEVPERAKDLMITGGDDIGVILANPIPQTLRRVGDVFEQRGDKFRELKFLLCKIGGKELVSDAVIVRRALNKTRPTITSPMQFPHGFQHGEVMCR